MKTKAPPGGSDLAAGGREGYGHPRCNADGSLAHGPDTFTRAQSLSLLAASILGALREGSGAASNVTLGERSLRRGYAGAKMCRVRQEGIHSPNHFKDTSEARAWNPPGVTKGRDVSKMKDQGSLFPTPQNQPTVDSIYLARQIAARWHASLTPAAIQTLVTIYGASLVEDKLRELHGFPPEEAIREPYAYLATMLRENPCCRSWKPSTRPTPATD